MTPRHRARDLIEIPDKQSLGLRVFSATMARDRALLGDVITDWIRTHRDHELIDKVVVQSSDAAFHCLTIVLFFRYRAKP
jgi:hypothetical protein